jgi:hypothetical protein
MNKLFHAVLEASDKQRGHEYDKVHNTFSLLNQIF